METLPPNPTYAVLKRFVKEAYKGADEFGMALDRFGREPGEAWHAAADAYRDKLAGLERELAAIKERNSLPAAARLALAARVGALAGELAESRRTLRCLLLDACPREEVKRPTAGAAEKAWRDYEELTAGMADRVLRLDSVVRLARRSHDPAAAFTLVCPPLEERMSGGVFELIPALGSLLENIPLPRRGGLTILEGIRKDFSEQALSGPAAGGLFARFMEGLLSGDPTLRKAARKELERARTASNDERYGRSPEGGFSNCREIWGVWAGVKAALAEPDAVRRRAALCALPALQFSFITKDFRDECADFIARGLADEDGAVRHKTLRFASDLALIGRVDEPEVLKLLEKTADRVIAAAKGRMPQAAASARKLQKAVAGIRRYDRERFALPGPLAGGPAAGGREVSFTTPRRLPFNTVYRFKIVLLGTKPPIWRRIEVPGSYTFYDLHLAIQNAMGWTDSHLHAFETGGARPVHLESPYAVEDIHEEIAGYTTEVPLSEHFRSVGDSAVYEYDFGDGWRHAVTLEGMSPKDPGRTYPACLDGRLACPPEDCGGPGGYANCVMLAGGGRPFEDEEENRRLKVWLGDWRPEKFVPADVAFEDPRTRFLETMEDAEF